MDVVQNVRFSLHRSKPPVYEQTAPQQSPIYEQPVYAAPVYEAVPNKPQVPAAQNVLSIIGMLLGIIGSLWTFFAFFSLTHPAFKSIVNSKINDVIVKRAADDSAELITNLVFPEE